MLSFNFIHMVVIIGETKIKDSQEFVLVTYKSNLKCPTFSILFIFYRKEMYRG